MMSFESPKIIHLCSHKDLISEKYPQWQEQSQRSHPHHPFTMSLVLVTKMKQQNPITSFSRLTKRWVQFPLSFSGVFREVKLLVLVSVRKMCCFNCLKELRDNNGFVCLRWFFQFVFLKTFYTYIFSSSLHQHNFSVSFRGFSVSCILFTVFYLLRIISSFFL